MANILITGVAGFIGSHLSEALLARGHHVIGIDNFDPFYDPAIKRSNLSVSLQSDHFTFMEIDIADPEAYSTLPAGIEIVIHLAAKAGVRPSIEAPNEYLRTNVEGTQYLLDWMVNSNIKNLLFASSSSVYGNNKKVPFSETDNVDYPISPYAYTKKACELMIHTYHRLYDLRALCLRFFTVYGPRQRPDLAIHKFTKIVYEGKEIPMFGDGSTARDYTFVADTVAGILKAMDYISIHTDPLYEIVNLGNNQPVKLKALIAAIFEATGKTVEIRQLGMQPGDVDITYADINKAGKLLGYAPDSSLEAGLKAFVKWYENTRA